MEQDAPTIWTKVSELLRDQGMLLELGKAIEREVLTTLASATMLAGGDKDGRPVGLEQVIELKGYAMGMRAIASKIILNEEKQAESEELATSELVDMITRGLGGGEIAATSRG